MNQQSLSLCFLYDVEKLYDFLILINPYLSKSFLKKYYSKKDLFEKSFSACSCIDISLNVVNYRLVNPCYEGDRVEVVFEDKDFIVLNKPIKVHTHPLNYNDSINLLSFLRAKGLLEVIHVNEADYSRGLINRPDFETSGIVLGLKNEKLFLKIRKNFHDYIKEKKYLAIVKGKFSQDEIVLKDFLQSFGPKGHKMKVFNHGQEGRLKVKALGYKAGYSLLLVSLETGLRHQIRVQLSHKGYPLVGDFLYGGEEAERMYLHAYSYKVQVGNNEYLFKTDHPKSFDRFFNLDEFL